MSLKLLSLLVVLNLASCVTTREKYTENQLEYKILRFRDGYKGATNMFCVEWNKESECTKHEVKEYDLNDAAIRLTLRELGFVCKIGSKRYKIDKDEPRLRRDTYERCGMFNLKYCIKTFWLEIDAKNLRELNARCFSSNKYPFDQQ